MIVLTASHLEELVDRAATERAVAQVFVDIATGLADQPRPTSMSTSAGTGRYVLMSALSETTGTAAVKLLADVPDNAARDLPTQRSMIVVVDREDGSPVALLHGGVPTRVRTAAASAVATRALSREDSRVLGLVGAGGLAREHVEALRGVRDWNRLVIWSRTPARTRAFADSLDWEGAIEVVDDCEAVFERAEVISTLTPSVTPIVRGEWLRPGQHLNVVGARPRNDEREVDAVTMARSSVWVDDIATAESKSGDLMLAVAEGALTVDDVVGTVGQMLAGLRPGRTSVEQVTLFNSVGIGAQDLAIADLLVRDAYARGIGLKLDLNG